MSSRTGQDIALDVFLPLNIGVNQPPYPTCPTPVYVPQHQLRELPEECVTYEALAVCYYSRSRFEFPIFDKVILEATVKKAYQESLYADSSHVQIPARACVWAIHAIATRVQAGWNQTLPDNDVCASRARALIDLVAELSNLEQLQAVLLLVS